jgi:hypothetical protein
MSVYELCLYRANATRTLQELQDWINHYPSYWLTIHQVHICRNIDVTKSYNFYFKHFLVSYKDNECI